MLERTEVTRYVAPLREGGSLPALVEAADEGTYVLKFRGAGQGPKALVAEVVVGELARPLGFRVPRLVVAELAEAIGRAEPDPEIQDLLAASVGENLGVDFLPGSLPFNPAAGPELDPELAARIVWLDALVMNPDRTARNPNLLWWHGQLWLIDHGAALYFHHSPEPAPGHERGAFPAIADHVLLPFASSLAAADAALAPLVTEGALRNALGDVPDSWLGEVGREGYVDYLLGRLAGPRAWVVEAEARRGT